MIEYPYADCVTFWRTKEPFGGLSNFAAYPITLGPHTARTSEHLYHVMRFPDHPDLQQKILDIPSPMYAKKLAHANLRLQRPDWHDNVKDDVMMWCLELKLACNRQKFGDLLLSTGNREIVEASPMNDYWGAKPIGRPPTILRGWNVLGRLLGMLRRKIEVNLPLDLRAHVIDLPNFRLGGEDALVFASEYAT